MSRAKTPLRWLLTVVMVGVGIAHFVFPAPLEAIVPAWLPNHHLLVLISGVAEIAGGVGLQLPMFRRLAAWGLIALYVAVFPANLNQAMNHIEPTGSHIPGLILWARLPLQILLIAWAYWYTRREPR
jgi:uncharacterized membrane protein